MHNQIDKKAQIWIETVIYTLIAFALIATVLAFVKPKIDEMQDKAIIEQTISMMKDVDSTVSEIVQGGSGNKRKIEVGINKGTLSIDGENDLILFEIDSEYVYSEPGKEIENGNLLVKTEEVGGVNKITIKRNYTNYNITFSGKDEMKSLSKASTPYTIFVTNNGKGDDEKWEVDFEIS